MLEGSQMSRVMSNPMAPFRYGLLLLAACGGETTFVDPPPPPPALGFRVQLTADPEDVAAAQALGWATGIPDAQVTITPEDSSAAPRVLQGSASGTVELEGFASGSYIVEAQRWLTPAEWALLPASQDVVGWVAKGLVRLTGSGADLPLAMAASRRKGLMISEWAFNIAALQPVNETYPFGGFLEIYNNADTTAYLDGLIIARGILYDYDYPNFPCSATAALTTDPNGIWTREVQQFPGRGEDYPVPPGGLVTVAIDAIDHSAIVNGGIDLSGAEFEFWGGPGDVDNPAAVNMIDTLALGGNALGHGPVFQNLGSVAVLARAYDLATVPRQRDLTGSEYAQISADRLIDVVTLWPEFVSQWPRCSRIVHSRFDRASFDGRGQEENTEYRYSISRRSIPGTVGGQPVLQHSRNSDADFMRTLRSPGIAP